MLTLLLGMMFINTKNSPSMMLNSIFIVLIIINIVFCVYWLILVYPVVYPKVIMFINKVMSILTGKKVIDESGDDTPANRKSRRTNY